MIRFILSAILMLGVSVAQAEEGGAEKAKAEESIQFITLDVLSESGVLEDITHAVRFKFLSMFKQIQTKYPDMPAEKRQEMGRLLEDEMKSILSEASHNLVQDFSTEFSRDELLQMRAYLMSDVNKKAKRVLPEVLNKIDQNNTGNLVDIADKLEAIATK